MLIHVRTIEEKDQYKKWEKADKLTEAGFIVKIYPDSLVVYADKTHWTDFIDKWMDAILLIVLVGYALALLML